MSNKCVQKNGEMSAEKIAENERKNEWVEMMMYPHRQNQRDSTLEEH